MPLVSSEENVGFLGGPPALFERAGREQLIVLLEHDLSFDSRVLDIGCGCLRGGRWIIPLLHPGHYCGIEPAQHMVERGLAEFLDPEVAALKNPRFDFNADFDFSPFGVKFTHFLARSIWTHASKPQIERMLDGVIGWGEPDAVMLASFRPASAKRRNDYWDETWIGHSHECERPGIVAHSVDWIATKCQMRGLSFTISDRPPLRKGGQVWAVVRKPDWVRTDSAL